METWLITRIGNGEAEQETVEADSCYVEDACLVFTIISNQPDFNRVVIRIFADGEWLDVKLVTEEEA